MRFRARRVCRFAIAVVFTASLVPATLARAQAAQAGGGSGAVAGSVAVRQSGQPVPGAVVSLEGTSLTAVSNQTGRFRIDSVPPGSVMLVVRAPGFLDAHAGAVQVRAGDTAQIDVELDVTPNFMERVQVTATKTPLSIGDVPAQTDIVSRATIESRGDQTLTQAISHVPGAVVSTQLGIFESVMLRGMPSGDPEFTNTLLLIDGVPQATPATGRAWSGYDQRRQQHRGRARPQLGALRADGHRRLGQHPDGQPDGEAGVQCRFHGRRVGDGQGAGARRPVRSRTGAATTSRSGRSATAGTSIRRPATTTRTATRRCSASSRSCRTRSRSAASASTASCRTTARRPTSRSSRASCCTTSIRASID